MCSNRLYHPLALLGVLIFLRVTQGSAAARLHPGLLSPALTGSKFRGRADLKLLDKLAFITFFGGRASLRIIKSDAAPKIGTSVPEIISCEGLKSLATMKAYVWELLISLSIS